MQPEQGKSVALVTGGGVGIGRAVAVALATSGVRVAVTYRSHSADDLVAEVRDLGGVAASYFLDVMDASTVADVVGRIRSDLGPITILVNNAGGLVGRVPLAEMADEFWQQVLDLNLTSAFRCTRATLAQMPDGGRIVNVSSLAGLDGGGPGSGAYAAAKAGLLGLTRALAKELAPRNITVNAVAPGLILQTPFHEQFTPEDRQRATISQIPLGRAGTPADVAAAVCWLVSPAAGWTTGEVVSVNGGQYFA